MLIAPFGLLAQLQSFAPSAGTTALAGAWRFHVGDSMAWARTAYEGGEEWPTVEQLVGAADAALYRAKSAGRNCVMT